jgi:hypothetical protein
MSAFTSIIFKLPRMRKAQSFLLYPYDGSDSLILQSDTRIIRLNIRTGEGILSLPHPNGSYFHHLGKSEGAYAVKITGQELNAIQEHLWNHSGTQTYKNVLFIENKELFSH